MGVGGNALCDGEEEGQQSPQKVTLSAETTAPLTLGPTPKMAAKKAASGSPAPITPTLGSILKAARGDMVVKSENKKEPRTKELAKAEGRRESRSITANMHGLRMTACTLLLRLLRRS